MRLAPVLLLAAGCTSSPGPETWTRDCIQTVDTGATLSNGPLTLVTTTGCAGLSRLENVQRIDGAMEAVTSYGGDDTYRAVRLAQLDGGGAVDTIGLRDDDASYAAWIGEAMPQRTVVSYTRPFEDLAVADLDRDGTREVILAGDGALRSSSALTSTERVLATGKQFRTVAATAKNELYYLAQAQGSPEIEIGVARASATDPFAFTATPLATDGAGPTRALAIADVDGDGLPDAIGLTSRVFVASSRTGTVQFLDDAGLAIGAGDIDADGVKDAVYLTADGSSVNRIAIAPDGSLSAEPLLAVHAQAMAVGDFDANGIADIAVVDRLRRSGSVVSLYRY